jgi:hypothetical protein
MKPVIGVYLGWIPPHSDNWEPLYRTMRVPGGYHSDRTRLYAPTIERYPGLEMVLAHDFDSLELPYLLDKRTPRVRSDYEYDAKLLNLEYPIADLFEYIGRSGGLFSGDDFTICPIVEPNEDGSYSYESMLLEFDPEVRDNLTEASQLKAIFSDGKQPIVTAEDLVLGQFLPHFAYLADSISSVNSIRIAEDHFFLGRQILISFDTPVNLYANSCFNLATEAMLSV